MQPIKLSIAQKCLKLQGILVKKKCVTTPRFALEAQNSKKEAYLSLAQLWKNITMCESDEHSRRKQLPNGGWHSSHPYCVPQI